MISIMMYLFNAPKAHEKNDMNSLHFPTPIEYIIKKSFIRRIIHCKHSMASSVGRMVQISNI